MAKEGRDSKGRFAEGNLFSIGIKNGRKPVIETAEELADRIAEYLDWEDSKKRPDSYSGMGKGIYTLSGCALYLGFSSKASIDDQMKRSADFSNVIKKFKLFMVDWNEKKMYWGGTFPAAQFWLKNWGGYSDESTQNVNQTITAKYGGDSLHTTSEPNKDTSGDK